LADRLIFKKVRQRFGGRLRIVVSGSAALSKEVAEFIDALGIDVFEGYGLTETAPVASVNTPAHRKIGSVGKPLPNVRIAIDLQATGDAKNGEIIVYGDNVMQGYHGRPDEDAKIFTSDGGLRTGDMGYLDEDGYLFITGRIKEQYKLENGKYVVPSPLEEDLKLSPYVGNIMLYGANKPYNVALVVLNQVNLAKWAEREGVTLGGDPTTDPQVRELLKAELETYSKDFRGYDGPRFRADYRRFYGRERHAHAQDEHPAQPGAQELPGHARRPLHQVAPSRSDRNQQKAGRRLETIVGTRQLCPARDFTGVADGGHARRLMGRNQRPELRRGLQKSKVTSDPK
jgi:acyl-CoA synthetase (AMP-forming)/AMP-acid ligase II